jgi:hypothetical protein
MTLRVIGVMVVLAGVAMAQAGAASRPKPGPESRGARNGLTAERMQRKTQQAIALEKTERAVTAGLDWLKRH